MKDIDFDELDKAVNSLMATTEPDTTQPSGQVQPSVVTLDEPVSAQSVAASAPVPAVPQQPTPVVAVQPTDIPEPAQAVPVVSRSTPVVPAARRSGRFMDMVHSSSEMKPSTPTSSREGISIAPRQDVPAPRPAALPQQELVQTEPQATPASSVMPDPIDLASQLEAVSEATPNDFNDSFESPFLADAKVEKRPLNSNQSPEPQDDINLADLSEPSIKEDVSVSGTNVDEPPVTPEVPELSSDLVAIEAAEKVEGLEATTTSTPIASSDAAAPAPPLGATSINQQYTAQPSTGDQSHAAIYDAEQYPEPVTHPAKKKSGWLWVVWVVLLLGVGAGGAVVLYNLGII